MPKKKKQGAMSQSSANQLREKAMLLCQQENKAQMEMAAIIYDLYYGTVKVGGGDDEMPLFKFFGHDTWFDYIETEVGMHVSTAAGYRMVHDVFMVRLKGEWDKSLTPSFTKMKALTRVVERKNVNSWLKKANRMSCCALEEEITLELHGKPRRNADRHFVTMLTTRQLTAANAILEVARQEFPELETRGELLSKILEQWDAAVAKKGRRLRLVGKAS